MCDLCIYSLISQFLLFALVYHLFLFFQKFVCAAELRGIKPGEINFDTLLDLENVRYLCQCDYEIENERTNIKTGDILLTTVATLGRSCIYNGFPKNLCFQRSVTVISTDIVPEYLKLFLDAPYFQKFIFNNATGTAQKGFYLNQLENVLVCVPPLSEQTRMLQTAEVIFKQLISIEKSLR